MSAHVYPDHKYQQFCKSYVPQLPGQEKNKIYSLPEPVTSDSVNLKRQIGILEINTKSYII